MFDKVTLYKKDSKKKIRVWEISARKTNTGIYHIKTEYGLKDGKMIKGPVTTICAGKVKRSIEEQVELQMNSLVKKQMDKGYVKDSSGEGTFYTLPQLAYDYTKKANYVDYINTNNWLISNKLDGVRVLIAKFEDGIKAYSRKGQIIKFAADHITSLLGPFFDMYPECVLDGELYQHGKHLQDISGLSRISTREKWDEKGEFLTYHCFDLIDLKDPSSTNLTRWLQLQLYRSKGLLPNNDYFKLVNQEVLGPNLSKSKILDLVKTKHDKAVSDGYEGVMIKLTNAEYFVNKRTYSLLKVKEFTDSEFEIVGITPGVKRPEDYVIVLKTEAGLTFEAQPTGSIKERMELLDEVNKNIGKLATVKYFYLTCDGVPFLPKFKCLRSDV